MFCGHYDFHAIIFKSLIFMCICFRQAQHFWACKSFNAVFIYGTALLQVQLGSLIFFKHNLLLFLIKMINPPYTIKYRAGCP